MISPAPYNYKDLFNDFIASAFYNKLLRRYPHLEITIKILLTFYNVIIKIGIPIFLYNYKNI